MAQTPSTMALRDDMPVALCFCGELLRARPRFSSLEAMGAARELRPVAALLVAATTPQLEIRTASTDVPARLRSASRVQRHRRSMPLTLDTSMPPRDTPEDPPTPAAQLSPLKSPTHFAVERPFSPRSSKFTFDDGALGGDEPARSASDSPKTDEFLRDVYRSSERVNEACLELQTKSKKSQDKAKKSGKADGGKGGAGDQRVGLHGGDGFWRDAARRPRPVVWAGPHQLSSPGGA